MKISLRNTLLSPIEAGNNPRITKGGISMTLLISAVALLAAPRLMPAGYSWLTHTTSESAAQGLAGAWLARLGFVLFGLAVIWLAAAKTAVWARTAVWFHLVFGVCMVATAAFAHHPWLEGVPVDPVEDFLHSLTATMMGFAFAFGAMARLLQREADDRVGRVWDVTAVAAATFLPMLMGAQPDIIGLLQRAMFAVAYGWYVREALQK
ncbi:MAG: DUF998 domain-containing protein [Anaerolinea sp.]|nr:DUF998 domain-containing protein [Anaerolinea sp.]